MTRKVGIDQADAQSKNITPLKITMIKPYAAMETAMALHSKIQK
jgi:hypothetical protein